MQFGTSDMFHIEYITFLVADFDTAYHTILGRPALTKFMAVPHYSYLVLKMPAPGGVLSLQANLAIAYDCDKESLALAKAFDLSACMEACLAESKKVPKEAQEISTMETPQKAAKATKTKEVSLGLADPAKTMKIGAHLDLKLEDTLISFLRTNADLFTWKPTDMPGVPRELIEHSLHVSPTANPIKQKL